MSLETVNGSLGDFEGVVPGLDPRIIFTPSSSAVDGSKLLFNRRIIVSTFDGAGGWSQEFNSTDGTNPPMFFSVSLRWHEAGVGDEGPWVGADFPDIKLFIPSDGPWDFAQIIQAPSNPAQIWLGPEPPTIPTNWTGWIDTDGTPPAYYEYEG
ncbi:hypothetical protein [Subtercola sp. YIM 133946]|uniref:hypothetical protein n=1 Tax=Subtercola sp. YIM 133946 TaxID=3118909 RepID=UPI002F94F034